MTDLMSVVADGNLLLASLVALVAGLISFASPCVLPLVPGFLGYVTGVAQVPGEAERRRRRFRVAKGATGHGRVAAAAPETGGGATAVLTEPTASVTTPGRSRTVLGALLFVAGFSVVFILGTLLASAFGAAMREYAPWLTRAGGVLVIAMALVFLGLGSQRQWSPSWRPRTGLAGAPMLGVVFGLGWAPCMGPTYAVIYALATNLAGDSGLVARGALLGVFYCIGLGIPFVLIAAGWQRALTASAWLRRHMRAVHIVGGLVLLLVGVLLVTGAWDFAVRRIQTDLIATWTTVL